MPDKRPQLVPPQACIVLSGRARGFTLIELIMVVVMLGVLAVFAAPRLFNSGDFKARGFHDETLALLRFAQKTAIAQRRTVCVALNDTGVTLTIDSATPPDGTCDAALAAPNAPRGGSGLSGSVAAFQYVALGSTDQPSNVVIAISNSTTITVDATTGYVYD
jgi:MSHA pilin protein MshC